MICTKPLDDWTKQVYQYNHRVMLNVKHITLAQSNNTCTHMSHVFTNTLPDVVANLSRFDPTFLRLMICNFTRREL